jgi:hypothetical protein
MHLGQEDEFISKTAQAQIKAAFAKTIVSAGDISIERKQQGNRKLGYRVWRIISHPHDFDTELLCRGEIDMIKAGGTRCNDLVPPAARFLSTSASTESFTNTLTAGKPSARGTVSERRSVSK